VTEQTNRLVASLSYFVAFELFLFAPLKFYPAGLFVYPSYATKFQHWGYPPWFARSSPSQTGLLAGRMR
jgi:hypothetical protein